MREQLIVRKIFSSTIYLDSYVSKDKLTRWFLKAFLNKLINKLKNKI